MKKQMNYADKKGVEFVVMIGEDEMNSEKITVKDLKSLKFPNKNLSWSYCEIQEVYSDPN